MSNLNVIYYHSRALTNKGSLVDRGTNDGLRSTDVRIIEKTGRSVDIQGIDNYQITDVPIVTANAILCLHIPWKIPSSLLENLKISIVMSIASL